MLRRVLGALGLGAALAAAPAAAAGPDPLAAMRPLVDRWYADAPAAGPGLHGLVLEVEVEGGVDVLAAYVDGRLRYLSHGGRAVIVDTPVPALAPQLQALWAAAEPARAQARPWQPDRRWPGPGGVRVAYLHADGARLDEGAFAALQRDPRLGPLLLAGSELLATLLQSLR